MGDSLSDLFEEHRGFGEDCLAGADSLENLFDMLESLESAFDRSPSKAAGEESFPPMNLRKGNLRSSCRQESQTDNTVDEGSSPAHKKLKISSSSSSSLEEVSVIPEGQQIRASHILVERNRRKQMNENLSILRSLMPSFYIKRADQASIIGGVVNFIKELEQLLRSLEEKRQRKAYSEVLSPRPVSSPRPAQLSPRPLPLSPRPPPLSPRVNLPISPRTPQPGSPYNPRMLLLQQHSLPSPTTAFDNVKELTANSKSQLADVEVKFSGPNLILKTTSPRIPGQALKIVSLLEDLALEVLHVSITTVDDALLHSFTIKIGVECELSAEELANEIQQTFC